MEAIVNAKTPLPELIIITLVTGGTGYIGRNLTKSLLGAGDEVHLLARPRSDFPEECQGAVIHEYDGNSSSVLAALEKSKPDRVYHLAALFVAEHKYNDIGPLIESNVIFGTQLMDAMIQHDCRRLIFAGTAWQTFEGKKGTPACLYAATKEAFEAIVRFYVDAHQLRASALKIYDTYGLKDPRRKLLSVLRESARTGSPLSLSPGEQKLNLLNIRDVVDAFLRADEILRHEHGPSLNEYYLSSGEQISVRDLVGLYHKVSGQMPIVNWGERPYRAREVMQPCEGPALPGWRANVTLAEGLREFASEGTK